MTYVWHIGTIGKHSHWRWGKMSFQKKDSKTSLSGTLPLTVGMEQRKQEGDWQTEKNRDTPQAIDIKGKEQEWAAPLKKMKKTICDNWYGKSLQRDKLHTRTLIGKSALWNEFNPKYIPQWHISAHHSRVNYLTLSSNFCRYDASLQINPQRSGH